jgi:hypothetical protein
LRGLFDLGFGSFEQELVVDLQQHAGLEPFAGERGGNAGMVRLMMSAVEPTTAR